MRALAGLVVGIGACLVIWAVARPFPQLVALGVGVVLVLAGGFELVRESEVDVLGDHPDERER